MKLIYKIPSQKLFSDLTSIVEAKTKLVSKNPLHKIVLLPYTNVSEVQRR